MEWDAKDLEDKLPNVESFNPFIAMKFDPQLISSYTIDELFLYIIKGEVTLEKLSLLMGENHAFLVLKNRIVTFEKIKEKDDWNSVKHASSDKVREFLQKYPNSVYANEAHERIEFLRGKDYGSVCYCISNKYLESFIESNSISFTSSATCSIVNTYFPRKFLKYLKRGNKSNETLCNSAVFAPAEIAEGLDFFVQVYIYKDEETDQVIIDSIISNKYAEQRSYTPLNFKIKTGDRISVMLDMHGLSIEGATTKSIIWQNKFTKCSFFSHIPIYYPSNYAKGDVYISANGLELGQMSFVSETKKMPIENITCNVRSKIYKNVFISYSHKDYNIVMKIAEAYKELGVVDNIFDRHSLSSDANIEKKIYELIDSCDLFLLFWSENAARSEWVKKERIRAFYAALDVPPRLRLIPVNISPYSPPPSSMNGVFHFENYDKLFSADNK